MVSPESLIPSGSKSGKCLSIYLAVETARQLALPGSFALSDPPHFLSAVFWLRLDAVSAFRDIQSIAYVEKSYAGGYPREYHPDKAG